MPMEAWHIFTILGKPVNSRLLTILINNNKNWRKSGCGPSGENMPMTTVSKLMQKLVKSPMSCIVLMRAMEVTVFVLWESGTSMALSERACKSLLISLLTKAGFF